MAEYLTYWKHSTAVYHAGMDMDHAASDQFGKVRPGDVLWIVTWHEGAIHLLTRLEVDRVLSQRQAERALGSSDLWEAEYHVLAEPHAASRISLINLSDLAPVLRFEGAVDRLPARYTVQSFRSMRRPSDASAALLTALWDAAWPSSPPEAPSAPRQAPPAGRAPAKPKGIPPQDLRGLVEWRAMVVATQHFEKRGFAVLDTSRNRPYDLQCTKPDESWYVEVKGTRSRGTLVNLTKNEVNFAEANGDRMVLFIVHSIEVEPHNGTFRAVGGEPVVFQPWRLSTGVLVATSYVYAP